jgi:uncharacterized ferritin-like protein (DUF455 family)
MNAVDLGVDISRRFRDQRQEIFEHGTPLRMQRAWSREQREKQK